MNFSDFFSRLINALLYEHPIHVMTVHFPIALAGAAVLFLILALWKRNETLEKAAFYNITLVAISSVVASMTGFRDYQVRFDGDAPNANVKIFLGISLIILSTIIAVTRWRKPQIIWKPATSILYLLGFIACFILAATLGFLGGVILYGF